MRVTSLVFLARSLEFLVLSKLLSKALIDPARSLRRLHFLEGLLEVSILVPLLALGHLVSVTSMPMLNPLLILAQY